MDKIAIVVDSTNSMPQTLINDLPLIVVPLQIHVGLDSYLDGVDISPDEFYRLLLETPTRPKTSAPSPESFLAAFRSLAIHYSHIACITLSSNLSATYHAALSASNTFKHEFPKTVISVIDSETAGGGLGLMALQAARNVAAGQSWSDLIATFDIMIQTVYFIGILDDLKYLAEGGRIPKFAAMASSLLSFKIILGIKEGKIVPLGKARTQSKAIQKVMEMVGDIASVGTTQAVIMYSGSQESALRLKSALEEHLHPTETLFIPFTPVIGAHTGPGLVGLALLPTLQNTSNPQSFLHN